MNLDCCNVTFLTKKKKKKNVILNISASYKLINKTELLALDHYIIIPFLWGVFSQTILLTHLDCSFLHIHDAV